MIEELDILDEKGIPTGKTEKRSVIHSTGLWHKVVHIYFYRKVGQTIEILIHQRAKTKDLNPNKWDTRFGGHVKAGESLEYTLKKEILEETGLKVDNNQIIQGPSYKSQKFPNNEFISTYFYHFDRDLNTLSFKDGEVQRVKWVKIEEIIKSMSTEIELWASSKETFINIAETIKLFCRI